MPLIEVCFRYKSIDSIEIHPGPSEKKDNRTFQRSPPPRPWTRPSYNVQAVYSRGGELIMEGGGRELLHEISLVIWARDTCGGMHSSVVVRPRAAGTIGGLEHVRGRILAARRGRACPSGASLADAKPRNAKPRPSQTSISQWAIGPAMRSDHKEVDGKPDKWKTGGHGGSEYRPQFPGKGVCKT